MTGKSSAVMNTYELETDGLCIKRFGREMDWFTYIFGNRAAGPETLPEADVIIGPIANDTIYDTLGIITSGLLDNETALKLLKIGPEYRQIVIKTDKAVRHLRWISSRELTGDELGNYRTAVVREEEEYQKQFAEAMESL